MRLPLGAAVLATAWLAVGHPAAADAPPATCPSQPEMTFTAWTSSLGQQFGTGAREYIFADGYICSDTDRKFQQFLAQNPPKAPNTIVVLNSGGGDLGAGLRLGELIRQGRMWTQVGSRFPLMIGGNQNIPEAAVRFLSRPASPPFPGYCYSSCTFAFMGGVNRWIDYGSNYGVHRFEMTAAAPDAIDEAQMASAALVSYLGEMGISPAYMAEMVKEGGNAVTNLSMKVLQQLNIVTPRWQTDWQIEPLSDNSGFFLDGATTDPWGTHEIAVTCAPKPSAPPASAAAAPPAAASAAPVVLMNFSLDPGVRAKASDLVGAVQSYVLELGPGWMTLPDAMIAQRASVAGARLSAAVAVSASALQSLETAPYIGFAFLFDPDAKLPLGVLEFASDLDDVKLKQFAATCH